MSYVIFSLVFVMMTFQTVVGEGNLQAGNTSLWEGFSQLNDSIQQLADLLEQRVQQVETTLTQYLNEAKKEILSFSCINDTVKQVNESKILKQEIISEVSEVMKEMLAPMYANIGNCECNPAKSCHQIKELAPESPSGYYYVRQNTGSALSVYCDMTRSCGGISGGWMKVASFNVDNSSHSCPSGLRLLTDIKRRCVMPSDSAGCASSMFDIHNISYQRVCEKVIGYQEGSTDPFANYNSIQNSIEGAYVDGVSLTHGHNPHHHIWTFASAVDESDHHGTSLYVCPCTNYKTTTVQTTFIGNNYFCDPGSQEVHEWNCLYHEDPLWDGVGCGGSSTCCSFNDPPWFMRDLSPPGTTDDIELRVCRDELYEDVGLKSVELYVQ